MTTIVVNTSEETRPQQEPTVPATEEEEGTGTFIGTTTKDRSIATVHVICISATAGHPTTTTTASTVPTATTAATATTATASTANAPTTATTATTSTTTGRGRASCEVSIICIGGFNKNYAYGSAI
ncbi:hypothetical protein BGZ97_006173 [Linnemannia gamsii]|uniref:Uncharacterized protein n=1 Tax=Linnemannia gamsii TaxID=64522 RepID=A0A9P6UET6_9FUNG|nr:hypothetical protein BGZ97_006173 [Linnemannia gamsii]